MSVAQGMNPMPLLLFGHPSRPYSAMCGSVGSHFSSAVPDLVLNLDVELALLPLETVV